MANTVYAIPITPQARVTEVLCNIAMHMERWKILHNADLVSIVRSSPNFNITFSNPVPLAERTACKIS